VMKYITACCVQWALAKDNCMNIAQWAPICSQ
jgi:hypothetical protein